MDVPHFRAMSPRLAFALEAVHRAAQSTLAHFGAGVEVDLKSDLSPLTVADRGAERLLREMITGVYPGEAILGEEEGLSGQGAHRWIIDPIDGTKSFVSGVPLYATLLGFEVEGEPVIGVAAFPALGEIYYAEKGQGAYLNGRPIRFSEETERARMTLCHAGLKGLSQHGMLPGMARISAEVMAARSWCDAYGHMMVASGRAAAMVDPIVSHWDVSPILPILREAGADCQNLSGGDPLLPVHPKGEIQLISSAPQVTDWLLEELRR